MTTAAWSHRLAGSLLVTVGALNVALGLLSLFSDQIQLSTGVAGGLVTAGLVTAALGTLVWRGNRLATGLALTVFTMLLVFQLTASIADDGTGSDAMTQQPVARFVVLGLLVVSLAVAAWQQRSARRHEPASR